MSRVEAIATPIGVPHFGCTIPMRLGSSPSRQRAKATRPMPTMSTRMTDVSPQTAAIEMRMPAHPRPTASKASARGAPSDRFVYFTMPVTTKHTAT